MKGHNRVGGIAVDQIKSIIARVERLEEEKAGIAADIRDIFAEAKGNGFDVKAIRTILKMRKMDAQEREEQETILETYLYALGMKPQMELFDSSDELETDAGGAAEQNRADEELFKEAVALVVRDRKASTNYVQRCLKIGYNLAASLIERMEREGVVSPANHVGKREVLSPIVGTMSAA